MMSALSHRLAAFLQNLDHMSAEGQQDAFINEVIENFGSFTPPSGDRSHQWELQLHGITASGANEEEAIANWKRLALKQHPPEEDIEDDGFITVHPTREQLAYGGRWS